MSIEAPLGLRDLLVNTIAGSNLLFGFLAIIFFSFLAARFRMPSSAFLVLMVLFAVLFTIELGSVVIIILIVTGIVAFTALSKIFQGS